MKNIIVAISTVIVFGLMILTYQRGPAFHGGEAEKSIGHVSKKTDNFNEKNVQKQDENKEKDKLKDLKNQLGNIATFKVSNKYRSKCASCHGINGLGQQDGKKLMGDRLFGQNEEQLYKSLVDFKSGRRENTVMRGLLLGLNDDDLKELSKEISEFKARAEAQK